MKDWIGQAGMLSAAGFANGASCLNLFCLKQDKQSAITLLAPSMDSCIVVLGVQSLSKIKVLPDQLGKKSSHHRMSKRAFVVILI